MLIIQRILLVLVVVFYPAALSAQTSVDIVISGVEKSFEDNIRLFLSIDQQRKHSLLTEARLRRLHNKASKEISLALQPFGYYRPVITSNLKQLSPSQWQATYDIDQGPVLPVKKFELIISDEMRKDPEFEALNKSISFRIGEPFNHQKYENIKSQLSKLAAERGYFDARFVKHRVEIDLDNYEARIELSYEGGTRYRFGEVLLIQNIINEDLLKRYIGFELGSPYLLSQLIDLQHTLNDSDYFRTVEVSPGKPQLNSNEIPITVKLTPRKQHRYTFGLGYGTDTGARTKFGWEMPRLNSSGHRFDTEAKISEIGYSLSAHYRVPVFNPITDQLIYNGGIVNEKTDSSDSTVRTIGASLKRRHSNWHESISLNYQQEDYIIADQSGESTLLIPGIHWSRTWGKDFIYTIDGLRFDIGLRGASKELISDTNFTQLQTHLKAINAINRNNRFISRLNIGSTWTDEFEQLPSSVRFFAGGAQSVRGYAYQSLGPEDDEGKVLGGQYLLVGSVEYEHTFNSKWGFAIFYDTGNAVNNVDDNLEKGAGFGIRWKSPVGMVRIDLASALSQDSNPWRLHINIGPDL